MSLQDRVVKKIKVVHNPGGKIDSLLYTGGVLIPIYW